MADYFLTFGDCVKNKTFKHYSTKSNQVIVTYLFLQFISSKNKQYTNKILMPKYYINIVLQRGVPFVQYVDFINRECL